MIKKLLTGLKSKFNTKLVNKLKTEHKSRKLHKAILKGTAPRGRTI